MVKIVVDAMGSDDYPNPDIIGAVAATREYAVEIILVGDEKIIRPAPFREGLMSRQKTNSPFAQFEGYRIVP